MKLIVFSINGQAKVVFQAHQATPITDNTQTGLNKISSKNILNSKNKFFNKLNNFKNFYKI